MQKIIFYKLNEMFQSLLNNQPRIINNLVINQNIEAASEQLQYLLEKIELQKIINQLIIECSEIHELIISENVIHLSMGNDIFEQVIIYDHYISYEFDNEYRFLYKKLQKILVGFQEYYQEPSSIML